MLGAYSYLIELWGRATFDADINGDGRVDEEEYLEWVDMDLTGEGWITPHRVDHPDLGEVWIGGSAKKHMNRTPPARYIEMETLKNTLFVLYCTSQFPKVEISEVDVSPATADLYWVDVMVRNDRVYPTSSDRAVALGIAVKDKLLFSSSENISLIEIPAGPSQLDSLNVGSSAEAVLAGGTDFRLRGRESKRFRGLVQMTGTEGWLEIHVESKHGGKAQKRIELKTSSE
jgi:hypothetical protein